MNNFRSGLGGINFNTVVMNLLIINIICYLAAMVFGEQNGMFRLNGILGLFLPGSDNFAPYQLLSHMFMHGSFMHIFFNMYALFLFGSVLERSWGPKRFLIYYLVCGFGAALLHLGVNYWEALQAKDILLNFGFTEGELQNVLASGRGRTGIPTEINQALVNYYGAYSFPTVGASGAVFGLLLGYGMLFPNSELYMMFIPFPIKAKYFVIGYGAIELFMGFARTPGDNIAHFAHLGGMLFGFIMIKIWKQSRNNFY